MSERLIFRHEFSLTTDTTGSIGGGYGSTGQAIFRAPMGWRCQVHRLSVGASGYSPATPLTSGSMTFYRNWPDPCSQCWFLPILGVVAPVVIVEAEEAPLLADGEALVIAGAGLPASTAFFFALQVSLQPYDLAYIEAEQALSKVLEAL